MQINILGEFVYFLLNNQTTVTVTVNLFTLLVRMLTAQMPAGRSIYDCCSFNNKSNKTINSTIKPIRNRIFAIVIFKAEQHKFISKIYTKLQTKPIVRMK